jgi:hypothetical protein
MLDLVADLSGKPSRSPQLGMLGIHYRWSSYFRLGSDDELKNSAYIELTSRRRKSADAPDLVAGPNQVTSLFDTLSPVRHTILLFISAG